MGLKEDIENAITAGESAREREPKAQADFYEEWLTARESIRDKLLEAAGIFTARFGRESIAKFDNGSLYLNVNRDGRHYRMTFAADKESKEVLCSFDFPEGGKPLSRPLNGLTDSLLTKILIDFAYAVAWAPNPSGGMVHAALGY